MLSGKASEGEREREEYFFFIFGPQPTQPTQPTSDNEGPWPAPSIELIMIIS